jgi:polyribonucleotide nucleotidyltransferase
VIGTAGTTVVLSTVAVDSVEKNDSSSLEAALLTFCNAQTGFAPLTVTYQERHHGVGRIPSNARRRDNLRSTDDEVLAGRAIDRALRPLLVTKGHMPNAIHLTCSVQAHDLWGECGSPVALALNSASVALSRAKLLQEPVACVYLCCMEDGTVIMDPTPSQVQESLAELLYAGTRTNVVMMECSSPTDRVPEVTLVDLMKVAHAALEPVFEVQQELISAVEEDETDDEQAVRTSLGLPLLTEENAEDPVITDEKENDVTLLFDEASKYIETQLKDSSLRLFGYSADAETQSDTHTADVSIQPLDQPLLSKALRGRREHVVFTEIERLLKNGFAPNDQRRKSDYDALVQEDSEALTALARAIHNRLLKVALAETATQHHSRGDGRGEAGSNGCRVVRPISVAVPALPDSVHGSAVFARGDTQVLCTATLGAPVDGIVKNNPYQETTDPVWRVPKGERTCPKGPTTTCLLGVYVI